MKLKICGMRDNIDEVAALAPDYMGFIFYKKSRRYVGDNFSPEQLKNIPSKIKKTAVFVNENEERVNEIVNTFGFDAVQLHGDETPEYCRSLYGKGFEVIKAFGIDKNFDFGILESFIDCCDYFLFDTKSRNYGGTGQQFNHELLKRYSLSKPYFLSGGIGVEEVQKFNSSIVQSLKRIYSIDINSKVEDRPGLKNIELIKIIIKSLGKI